MGKGGASGVVSSLALTIFDHPGALVIEDTI